MYDVLILPEDAPFIAKRGEIPFIASVRKDDGAEKQILLLGRDRRTAQRALRRRFGSRHTLVNLQSVEIAEFVAEADRLDEAGIKLPFSIIRYVDMYREVPASDQQSR